MEPILKPASDSDLPFARTLARQTMMPYYRRHGLLWRDLDFDDGWAWRENHLLHIAGDPLGFFSLSTDARALYIRELHLIEAARGQGLGSRIMDYAAALGAERRLGLLRLMVFKDNPAQKLYHRKGLVIVGDDGCFWRMERQLQAVTAFKVSRHDEMLSTDQVCTPTRLLYNFCHNTRFMDYA